MRLLAIDTSSRSGSVALLDQTATVTGTVVRALPAEPEYSRVLVPEIEALLAQSGCPPGELDALAVAVGPGAFTGLRVGIATAQGLALARAKPCFGVNTLEAWSVQHSGEAHLAIVLDAFRGEVLWVLAEDGTLVTTPANATPEAFAEQLPEGALLVGEGGSLYGDRIRALRSDLRFSAQAPQLAASVAGLALQALRAGASGAAHSLRPLYLREAYVGRA